METIHEAHTELTISRNLIKFYCVFTASQHFRAMSRHSSALAVADTSS